MAVTPDPLAPQLDGGAAPRGGRGTGGIFTGVAVATCGAYAAVTMAPVVAHDITGSAFLAGLPVAALLAGAGWGASRVTNLIGRYGHQTAFATTYLLGAVACATAVVAVVISNFALLIAAVAGIGMGHAANQLARYAAAELHPAERRAGIIGWMVWAQAIGAVLGPLSLSPAGRVSEAIGLPSAAGGFGVGVVLFALAAVSHALGPRYRAASAQAAARVGDVTLATASPRALPTVQIAVTTMVVFLAVMLLVMTVTPVHVDSAGHGVGAVGAIMSAHTFGMFALAPVAGWLTGRLGSITVILAGLVTLLAAALAGALAPASSQTILAGALFLLGFGWCLGFVAASTLLTRDLAPALRVRLQGRVESLTWITGAVAATGSGLLLGQIGYSGLNLLAGALLVIPLGAILLRGGRTVGAPEHTASPA